MRQLDLFPEDADHFSISVEKVRATITPAEEALLRELDQEQALARLSPEDLQRHWARIAEEQRRAARESRRAY